MGESDEGRQHVCRVSLAYTISHGCFMRTVLVVTYQKTGSRLERKSVALTLRNWAITESLFGNRDNITETWVSFPYVARKFLSPFLYAFASQRDRKTHSFRVYSCMLLVFIICSIYSLI